MSSILRQIVAGPRLQHPEAGLDLCYVTDTIIATSGPSATYPQRAYRNPLDELVKFLDSKHGENWCIWEFRAEGTGYPDSEVYNRIHHFPWPDHHPPPFALIPNIMASMRDWLHRLDAKSGGGDKGTGTGERDAQKRVAVVHCKAGKGRSGTIATSYLISQEGWKKEDALQRFTERRMRVGFGNGVSIPSQLRYVGYVDRWTNQLGKQYIERPVEILEVHLWGLRDGVKVAVEGYVDEGKKIKCLHLFHRKERVVVETGDNTPTSTSTPSDASIAKKTSPAQPINTFATQSPLASQSDSSSSVSEIPSRTISSSNLSAVIFRPNKRIIVPNSDVNIDFERRSKASYTGFAMVTSVAHVWFNAFFEGGAEHDSGIFETEWDAMDGIKGSARKGIRAFERLKVVWRYPAESSARGDSAIGRPISEPKPGEPVHESAPADWRGKEGETGEDSEELAEQENIPPSTDERSGKSEGPAAGSSTTGSSLLAVGAGSLHALERQLGLRRQTDESKDVSLAGTEDEAHETDEEGRARKAKAEENGDLEGVQSYLGNGEQKKDGGEQSEVSTASKPS